MGMRLEGLTEEKPKALIEVEGNPLVLYTINFMKNIGINKINVIGGFYFNDLKKVVNEIDSNIYVVENDNYKKENLYTLDVVLPEVNENFLIMNIDHIYHKEIIAKVKSQFSDSIIAFTDHDRKLGDDDMKVLADSSSMSIKKISKKLDNYNCGYVGITYCPKNKIEAYRKAVKIAKERYGDNAVVENVLQVLADTGEKVDVGDISGHNWLEIDFPEELKKAEREITRNFNFYF